MSKRVRWSPYDNKKAVELYFLIKEKWEKDKKVNGEIPFNSFLIKLQNTLYLDSNRESGRSGISKDHKKAFDNYKTRSG
ncbi:MAG: hypothetical protein OXJ52_05645 [Oligoflexia bacterium]|nr:hypothetical protein [Oligoflexia bacterium]